MLRELVLGASVRGCSPLLTQHLCVVLPVLRSGEQQQLLLTPPTLLTQSGIPASHLEQQRAEASTPLS